MPQTHSSPRRVKDSETFFGEWRMQIYLTRRMCSLKTYSKQISHI
ncbi:hypothetical protein SLEP1_g40811 [Rubroshorea leprosula]|uniref:Uncharacterized protein n=1 Tax=Rubroshorea leprosula TaxID=152421 RepID=A0AAV5L4K3_9ROSI|nr:hypothetical protein SLEP1_g40811 [Rubroshorea leprosula]